MGEMFSAPKAPDTSAQQRLQAEQAQAAEKERTQLEEQERKKRRAIFGRNTGRQSLLTGGQTGTGAPLQDTLG